MKKKQMESTKTGNWTNTREEVGQVIQTIKIKMTNNNFIKVRFGYFVFYFNFCQS